jgi:hypothetical protein
MGIGLRKSMLKDTYKKIKENFDHHFKMKKISEEKK